MNAHAALATQPARPTPSATSLYGTPGDDRELIRRCKVARRLLVKEGACWQRIVDLETAFGEALPQRPTPPGESDPFVYGRTPGDIRRTHRLLDPERGERVGRLAAEISAFADAVERWDLERERLERKMGLPQARRAARLTNERATAAVESIVHLRAQTGIGMAWKAALLSLWFDNGHQTEAGDDGDHLSLSIAEDARQLGAGGGNLPPRSPQRFAIPALPR